MVSQLEAKDELLDAEMRSNIAAHISATEKIKALLTNVREVCKVSSFSFNVLFHYRTSAVVFFLLFSLSSTVIDNAYTFQVADELGQTLRTDEIVEWALEVDETGET